MNLTAEEQALDESCPAMHNVFVANAFGIEGARDVINAAMSALDRCATAESILRQIAQRH